MNAPDSPLQGFQSPQHPQPVVQPEDGGPDGAVSRMGETHFVPLPLRDEPVSGNVQAGHYRAYRSKPFTREERSTTTVLFGGLHWRVERVMHAVMENLGYKAQILPPATRADLLTAREIADVGQCCPTSFTTGNLANFLRNEAGRIGAEEVTRRYVHFTAGACGACRFGQYHHSYELALRNIGLESFRLFLIDQDPVDQDPTHGGGLDFNMPFTLGFYWAIVLTDLIQDMEYQIRPYEVHPGETNRISREAIEYLHEIFCRRPVRGKKWGSLAWHVCTGYFADAMREIRKRFDQIEVDRLRVKPLVKITGEFYLQVSEGEQNYNIHQWLEAEGAEVYPAAISIWLDYLLRLAEQEAEDHIGVTHKARLDLVKTRLTQMMLRRTYSRMRRALGDMPHELIDQYELRRLAAPYFHSRMNGGEGDMLIGKALWVYHHKKAHMVCELSPYSCMPNTMSVGAMAAVIGRYPDLLYAPLEIKGDAEVHALSRCQMVLTEARKRARREYEDVLERTGLSETAVRDMLDTRPDLKRATCRIPHYGVAGTAANLVLHLALGKRA